MAATRAAFWLGCPATGGVTAARCSGRHSSSPRSRSLRRRRGRRRRMGGGAGAGRDQPGAGRARSACWPAEIAADARHAAVRAAGELVDSAIAAAAGAGARRPACRQGELFSGGFLGVVPPGQHGRGSAGRRLPAADRCVDRGRRPVARRAGQAPRRIRARGRVAAAAAGVVAGHRGQGSDGAGQAGQAADAAAARACCSRGTEFHQWLEQRFGQAQLIDADDLPGAADDAAEAGQAAADGGTGLVELAELKARFEAGEWADRWPVEVEVPFQTLIADRLVSGRIDAVFAGRRLRRRRLEDRQEASQRRGAARRRCAARRRTGWPGRRWPACRWSRCAPRSTTCVTT